MKKIASIICLFLMIISAGVFLASCNKTSPCANGHSWGEYQIVEATCTEKGTKTRTCSVCQAKEEEILPALGHNWGNWTLVYPATCETGGQETRSCLRCGDHEEQDIQELGHKYQETYEYNETYHWQSCSVCGTETKRTPHTGKECSVCGYKNLPSLKAVMTNLAGLRNYTYELEDQIFDVTTTFRYTEKAFYYQPSQKEHGGDPYGYAQSQNNEVFSFVIENDAVVPGYALKNSDGSYKTSLWDEAIISFSDFNLDAFTDKVNVTNTYEITDDANKLLFALLAGYGDTFAMEFVSVKVEVISENAIKTILHFEPGDNQKYTGDCIGIIKEIGTTTIPEIEEYLEDGNGPKVADADDVLAFLARVKESHQFKVEVTSSSKHFIDIFTENYYYSFNEMNESDEKGYIVVNNHIYQFKLQGDKVLPIAEITYTTDDHSSLWAQNVLKSLNDINLTDFAGTLQDDGTILLEYNVSIMNSLYSLTHDSSFFFFVNQGDSIVFAKMEDDSLTYTYNLYTGSSVTVTISEVGSAKNDIVESNIESGIEIIDPNDISKLKEQLGKLAEAQEYDIDVVEQNMSFEPATGFKAGNKHISYTENSYYQQNLTDNTKSKGYAEDETGIYQLGADKTKGAYVEEDGVVLKGLYASNLFATFASLDLDNIQAEQQMDGSFKVSDSNTIATFFEIAGYDGSVAITYYDSCLITISDTAITITLKGTGFNSYYGSIVLTINL